MKNNKDFPNIKVNVSCIPNAEKHIKNLFFDCLTDYTKRFNTKVLDKKFKLSICLVEYEEDQQNQGLTVYNDEDNKLLIQVKDPFISGYEYNNYVMDKFVSVLCHEIVHACQYICNRQVPKMVKIKHDKDNDRESYFFDPSEMEARLLEAPYLEYYGYKIT